VRILFSSLLKFWELNALEHSAIPCNQRGVTLACFTTRKYASPSHVDPHDPRFTFGIRFCRGRREPASAYHFCYPTLRRVDPSEEGLVVEQPTLQRVGSSEEGLVVEQPGGTIGLWEGAKFYHGSSCDVRSVKDDDDEGSIGAVLTQKPLMLQQTQRHKHTTQEVADTVSWYKQKLEKTGTAEWESLKEDYGVSKLRTRGKKENRRCSDRTFNEVE